MRIAAQLDDGSFSSYHSFVKLTLQLQLLPSTEQRAALLDAMRQFNAAATYAAKVGFAARRFSQPSIHTLCYPELRSRFGLSAQMAVRAIGKAVECFHRDRNKCSTFRPDGAMAYDERMMSFKGRDRVSLLTLNGRQIILLVCGEYQRARFDRIKGQCDLVFRQGKFFLYCTVDLPDTPPSGTKKFLGVDLGLVSLATTSEGQTFSGELVERCRQRHAKARQQFQRRNTRGAKRRLRQLSGRQRRFQTWVNHGISTSLVASAKALGVDLALEELTNIRTRTEPTVRRKQRGRLSNWAFRQLREFVTYKARLAGVPVQCVDPRNSSRECSQCGYTDKANRKTQADFLCGQCGYAAPADVNAARNLAARAVVNQPD